MTVVAAAHEDADESLVAGTASACEGADFTELCHGAKCAQGGDRFYRTFQKLTARGDVHFDLLLKGAECLEDS